MSTEDHKEDLSISIVMPIGRVDEDLRKQLESLACQTMQRRWELVLSLNDKSAAAARDLQTLVESVQLDNVSIVEAFDGEGAAYARNTGAKAATGDLLCFLDSDDIAAPTWLHEVVSSLENNPDSAIGGYLEESTLGIKGQETWRPPATPAGLPVFLGAPYLVSANMGIRSEHFWLVGGFDEDLIRCEDIAMSWELQNQGVSLLYEPRAIVHYRHRKGLKLLLEQHFMYGRGFTEVLSRYRNPSESGSETTSFLGKLKPNGQRVEHRSIVHYARRGAIAVGRIYGLAEEKLPTR